MNLFLFILLPWLLIFHICCILHSSQLPTIMAHSVSTGYAYAGGNIRGSRPEIFLRKGILKLCSKFLGQSPSLGVISLRGSEGGVGWWRTLSRPIAFGAPISLTWLCNCPATAGHSKICSYFEKSVTKSVLYIEIIWANHFSWSCYLWFKWRLQNKFKSLLKVKSWNRTRYSFMVKWNFCRLILRRIQNPTKHLRWSHPP